MRTSEYTNFEAITFLEIHIDKYVLGTMRDKHFIPESDVSKKTWKEVKEAIDWSDYNTRQFMRGFIQNLFSQNIDFISLFTEYKDLFYILFPSIPRDFSTSLQTNKYHLSSIMMHSLISMGHYKGDNWLTRIACLLHDIGKIDAKSIDEDGNAHFYGHNITSANMFETLFKNHIFTNEESLMLYTLLLHHDDLIPEDIKSFNHLFRKLQDTLRNKADDFNVSFDNIFFADLAMDTLRIWTELKKCDVLGHYLSYSKNLLDKVFKMDNLYTMLKHSLFESVLSHSINATGGDLIKYANLKPCPQISKLLLELAYLCYTEYKNTGKIFSHEELVDIIKGSQNEREKMRAQQNMATKICYVDEDDDFIKENPFTKPKQIQLMSMFDA